MSLLDTLRKLRGTGASINQDAASLDAEIATLRAEEADLLRRPLPFEDWRAHLLESIAYQAGTAAQMQRDSIRGLLTSGHTGKIAPDTDGSYRGETRYGVDGVVKNWDVLQMTRFRPDAPGTAGLAMPFVLYLLKDRILAELPDLLEPLRAEWPAPSECGPTREARQKRIAEIAARISELESIKAELVDAARELLGNLDPDALPLPEGVRRRA